MRYVIPRLLGVALACAAVAGCSPDLRSNGRGPGATDDAGSGGDTGDLATWISTDMSVGPPNECGDHDPGCTSSSYGPPQVPFPLSSDPQPDPNESDTGVDRDPNGYIVLGATHAAFNFIYTSNTDDWGRGTVSKVNSKSVKEVARYMTVTCFSQPAPVGSHANCDGTMGCCSRDDYASYVARGQGQKNAPHQQIQFRDNSPSRTAVDFNGDFWVSNRAFGGQSSVTKIANDFGSCVDSNGVPGIQTSSDVNGDGIIDTDCNRNGAPDDIADVMAKPCNNGKQQEFYGVDDDCILFTTNTNVNNSVGRPLVLGQGGQDFGPADAWPGSYNDGKFFRIDGTTGKTKAQGQVPGNPYGATIDDKGILWAPIVAGGQLLYLDTNAPQNAGITRGAQAGSGYGIGMDRDQNVWIGGYPTPHGYRYTPDRSNGFANLGKGFWTMITNVGVNTGARGCMGRGVAADSRSPNNYFVWMACHTAPFVVRLDGNIPLPMGADQTVDGSNIPSIRVAGSTIMGVGVDIEQNVWGIGAEGSVLTRILVDNAGTPTQPMLNGSPGTGCPVGNGDYCGVAMAGVDPGTTSYTYSDFTGFGLRNFTLPKGTYQYIQSGCSDAQKGPVDTKWSRVAWDAELPPNTSIAVRARSGPTPQPDQSWGQWTGAYTQSPGDLPGILNPEPSKYIQVEFDLTTLDKKTSPKLKDFNVYYECPNQPG